MNQAPVVKLEQREVFASSADHRNWRLEFAKIDGKPTLCVFVGDIFFSFCGNDLQILAAGIEELRQRGALDLTPIGERS